MSEYKDRLCGHLLHRIEALSSEYPVRTNSGTYGGGDPRFDDWTEYEALDGARRIAGANPDTAPGYARHLHPMPAAARRAQIRELQLALETLSRLHPLQSIPPHVRTAIHHCGITI